MTVTPYAGSPSTFPSHSTYDPLITSGGASRVLATNPDGEHYAWQFTAPVAAELGITDPDRVVLAGLKTPSTAKLAEMAAQVADGDAALAKDATAKNYIAAQVNAIKAGGPQSGWTTADKRFMAIVWVLHRLD